MKITFTLILISCMCVSAAVHSQSARVSISAKQISIGSLIRLIEKNSPYKFTYSNNSFPAKAKIDVNVINTRVSEVLNTALANTGFEYKLLDNNLIAIVKNNNNFQAAYSVSGFVMDETGQPIPGVTVKNTSYASAPMTATKLDGSFEILVNKNSDVLSFSFIGYKTQNVSVGEKKSLKITMTADNSRLNEVVVIGYGTSSRRELTGSVGTVSAETISQQPVQNALQAIQGRMPGVLVNSSSGRPGSSVNVSIRGSNSIGSGNEPLYIVDGVQFLSTPMNVFTGVLFNSALSQSPLSSINPDDIESIDVLKDADATAIYGSRAANGVVLITTKKGKVSTNKINVNAEVYSGVESAPQRLKFLNTQQYLAIRKQAYLNDGLDYTSATISAPDLKLFDQNYNYDWQKALIGNTANYTNSYLNVEGGSPLNHFLISGSYRTEGSVMPGSSRDDRIAIHSAYSLKSPDQKFALTFTNDFSYDKNTFQQNDLTSSINYIPNLNPYNDNGTLNWTGNISNPFANLYRPYENRMNNLVSNLTASYLILPGLNAKISGGYNSDNLNLYSGTYQASINPATTTKPSARFGTTQRTGYVIEPQLDFSKQLGDGKLQLLAGGTIQKITQQGNYYTGSNYSSDLFLRTIAGAGTVTVSSGDRTDYRYQSLFGRATYNWKSKYILNGSVRRDGSSRFGPNNQFGTFGAVGAAWIFSQESFIKDNINFLSFGKLRSSYGTVGNDQIGDYKYYSQYSLSAYSYQGTSLTPANIGNNNYSWEKVNKFDLAIDLGFFKDRITASINYYRNDTKNQLVGYALPQITGFSSVQYNLPAIIRNEGWEFELSSSNIHSKDFKWDMSFNLTAPTNRLVSYPNLATSTYANTYVIGQSINLVKGYVFNGVNPATGSAMLSDLNKDGNYSSADQVVLGSTAPRFYGGFQNTFSYKKLQLSFFLQFAKQQGYNYLNAIAYPPGSIGFNYDVSRLNIWTTPGQVTNIPKASTDFQDDYYNYTTSTATWGDASYIRLKNLYVSYSLPQTWLEKAHIKNASIYIQGQNLFTISGYLGVDPETRGLALPPLKMYSAGIKLSL